MKSDYDAGASRTEPPRWAQALVGWCVPFELKHEVLHDLAERFAAIASAKGHGAALRWYGGQLIRISPNLAGGTLRAVGRGLRGEGPMHGIVNDIRFTLRNFARRPVFAAVAIGTLALGIGANTAIFSIVDGILLRPLPYPEAAKLVTVWADYTRRNGPLREWLAYPNYVDIRDSGVFEEISVYGGWFPTLTGSGPARQLEGASMSQGMFSRVLRVTAFLGRDFLPEEDVPNGRSAALLSHRLWQSEFAGDSGVVGRSITLDGIPTTVVGVMPSGFRPPFHPDAEIWTTAGIDASVQTSRGQANLKAVGRLSDTIDVPAAQRLMRDLGTRLELEYPQELEDVGIAVFGLHDDIVHEAATGLWLLLGAVVVVLLIASINVANLMLARTMARRSEMAIRAAIGAGSARIVRQLLTEGAVLAVLGAALGILLGKVGLRFLVTVAPADTPLLDQVALDYRVLAFATLSTAAVALLFGLIPALNVTRRDLHDNLRSGRAADGDKRSRRTGSALVAGQIALTLALLVGSGLLIQTLRGLTSVDPGFDPESRVAFSFFLPPQGYNSDDSREFLIRLEERLALIPGIVRVGSVSALPLAGRDADADFLVQGDPPPEVGERRSVWYRGVTPDYFDAMGIAIISGRALRPTDDQEAPPVVLINEEMAERYFGDRNPIGMRINVNDPENPVWREIVGVTANVKNFGVRNDSRYVLHIPHRQIPFRPMYVVLHTDRAEPLSLVPDVRAAMTELDPNIAAADIEMMSDALNASFGPDRFVTILLGLFAALSLLLSMVGLYGVVSYSVSRRQREMGVRIAVGASSAEIRGLVVWSTLRLVGAGAAAGLVVSLLSVRFIDGILFGVEGFDPLSFAAAAGTLAAVSVLAALAPAIRAAAVDPVTVLKAE